MNDSDDPLSDELPDELIDELLAPLRAVDCPEEVRRANRQAIQPARRRRAYAPWWRRTVAVPIPLAVAASIALVVTAGALLWPALSVFAIEPGAPQQPRQANVVDAAGASSGWSLTRSYILSIESLAKLQDSFRPDVMEERNDT